MNLKDKVICFGNLFCGSEPHAPRRPSHPVCHGSGADPADPVPAGQAAGEADQLGPLGLCRAGAGGGADHLRAPVRWQGPA